MEVQIRNARAADAAAIARVHVETWRDTYAALLPVRYLADEMSIERSALHWARALRHGDGRDRTLVAVSTDGELLAYAAFGRSRERLYADDGELYALYVSLDAQNQGLGRRLCGETAKRFLADGRRAMNVEVLADNPSRFFYEALGAQLVARKTHMFAGESVPALLYRWPELTVLLARADAVRSNQVPERRSIQRGPRSGQ